MKVFFVSLGALILSFTLADAQEKFDQFSAKFVSGYQSLHMPDLELSYVNGLQHIAPDESLHQQEEFFRTTNAELAAFKIDELTPGQQTDYRLISYETGLNLERIALEQQWQKNKPAAIPEGGIITIPNGKAWYAYLLKRWVNDEVTPDQIYQFGLAEVERVKSHIEAIRKGTGMSEDEFYKHLNDPSFFISDPDQVQKAFEHTREIVYGNLHKLFSQTTIADLAIKRGQSKQLAQTPGYYDNNTFYYNLFDKPYNKRQIDWLFIHEAVPGHHYQSCIIAQTKVSDVQNLFFYMGFAEGWGAYSEELGKELGVYKTPYDELGKWQWDVVRSVRVPLDVGLNYYGWTDRQALISGKRISAGKTISPCARLPACAAGRPRW